MTHKYFKTISELIDDYVCIFDFSPANDEELYGDMLTQALIHAYELGYKHATEEGEASNG